VVEIEVLDFVNSLFLLIVIRSNNIQMLVFMDECKG
jgi:hypothetical protein